MAHTRLVIFAPSLPHSLSWHLASGEFRVMLRREAANAGVQVVAPPEDYSTQGCTFCGRCTRIGIAEVHVCGFAACRGASQGRASRRDGGAARNLLIDLWSLAIDGKILRLQRGHAARRTSTTGVQEEVGL